MRLSHFPRDLSRFIRRSIGFPPSHERLPNVLPLQQHHVANVKVFAGRNAYIDTLPKGAICAEVGVLRGDFSAYILEATKPRRLHLIDFNLTHYDVAKRFAAHDNIACHEGYSAQVLRSFADDYFDWVYIDAGHGYANVRADVDAAIPKVQPNGLLIFNDYILWSHYEKRYYGVVPVVNELCVNEGWRLEAFCLSNNMYCDVALRRGNSPSKQ